MPDGAGDDDAGEVVGKVVDDESDCNGVEGPLTTVAPTLVDVGAGADALLAGVLVAEGFVPFAADRPSAAGEFAAFGAGEFPDGVAVEDGFPGAEFPGESELPAVVLPELALPVALFGVAPPGVVVPGVAPCGGVAGLVFFNSEGL